MAVAEARLRVVPALRTARRVTGRLSWGVADQAMCSLTNFILSIYVARTLGAGQLGAFSLAYVTYGFAINASRGLSIEPLLIRFSGTSPAIWRRAAAGCAGTAFLVGLVTGACAVAAGAAIGGTTGTAFFGLGLMLPALLLQDSWRYAFFALGRGHYAFVNDAIWAAVQIPLMLLVKTSGHANVFWFILAWGAGAIVGSVVGAVQAKTVPSPRAARAWLIQHRDLGPRYLLENTGGNASGVLQSYGIASILGLVASGYIQAANVLMGPFKIIFFGMGMITIPEAARIKRNSPQRLPLYCLALSIGLTVLALAWTVALLVALPLGFGQLILGHLWRPAYPLVLPVALSILASCASTGAGVGLHALGAARRSLRVTLLTSALIVAAALTGAAIGGTVGTLRFVAAVSWIGTLMSWWQLRHALHESDDVRVPRWLFPRPSGKHHNPSYDRRRRNRRRAAQALNDQPMAVPRSSDGLDRDSSSSPALTGTAPDRAVHHSGGPRPSDPATPRRSWNNRDA